MASNSCREPLKNLLRCLRHTECFTVANRTLEDCAQDPPAMTKCQEEFNVYQQCRQGLLDGRSRIRGNKALR